jgi:hypothetical protein
MHEVSGSRAQVGAALLACLGLLVAVIFVGGSPGEGSVTLLGITAAALCVLGAAIVGIARTGRAGGLALACLAGLLCWAGVSIVWSIAGDRSWDAVNMLIAVTGFYVTGLVAVRALGSRAAERLALVVVTALAAATAWSLLGVAIPALAEQGDRVARLQEPVGYWNALAVLLGASVPLGGWLGARPAVAGRLCGALLVYGAVVALLLTQSRAGLLAALACTLGWTLVQPQRHATAFRLLLSLVPAGVVVGWALTQDALVEDNAGRAARVDAGMLFAVALCAGAVLVVALALHVPAERLARDHARAVRRGVATVLVALVAGGAGALVATTGNPFTWAGDQLSRGECVNDPSRLTELCANNRLDWWREAGEIFLDHPLGGTGARTFEVARTRVRDSADPVTQPHSLPLQLLADLGLVGLVLGAAFVVAIAAGRAGRRRRLEGTERGAALALACLPLVFGLHALVDYDTEFLSVTAPALLVAGALLGLGRPGTRRLDLPGGFIASGAVVLASVSLLLPWLSVRAADAAFRAGGAEAVAAAARAHRLNPLSVDALLTQALVAPDEERALHYYEAATELQPENWQTWYRLGLFQLDLRESPDVCAAYVALNNAYTLDPHGNRWVPGGPLDRARDAVNDPEHPACGR